VKRGAMEGACRIMGLPDGKIALWWYALVGVEIFYGAPVIKVLRRLSGTGGVVSGCGCSSRVSPRGSYRRLCSCFVGIDEGGTRERG